MRPQDHPLAALPLRAAAVLYAAVLRRLERRLARPGAVRRARVPVVSVGNLTVGGTGKTPLVAWLCQRLVRTRRPAVVSRGYGGGAGRGPLVVSTGAGPTCAAALCGDEPHLLASMLDGVPIVVGSDRAAGAERAAELGADVVVLDDGFQHRALARDLDLVLLDSTDPFGNGRLLPAGPLREPREALGRADVVILTRSGLAREATDLEGAVRRLNPRAPIVRARHRPVGFFDGEDRPVLRPARALAFCAVGNPDGFRRELETLGVELVGFEHWRDHHRFRPAELEALEARARRLAVPLVTTDKDRVRLPPAARALVVTLRIEAEVPEPGPLCDELIRVLGRAGGAA